MAWIKQHLVIFLIVVAIVVAVVWYGLSSNSEPPALLATETVGAGTLAEANADQEIVGSLLTLRAVTLNGTIFSDPAFLALQDFGTTLVSEPAGRENPFAPFGRSLTVSSSTQASPGR